MSEGDAPVLILTGPTGSGKSDWAMRISEQWPVESFRSTQRRCFAVWTFGTAKPDRAARAAVAHHLLDILEPTQSYSAGQFAQDATTLIAQIRARRHVPLLVGGTMLYLRALRGGLAQLPRASPRHRQAIDATAAAQGWPAMHAQLAQLDPTAASRIHPNDAQRIQRALEVCQLTGQPLSVLQEHSPCCVAGTCPNLGIGAGAARSSA